MKMRLLRNTKGQVTVFIIVGLVIFAVAGVSYFLLSDSFSIEDSLILRVSEEARPLYEFIDICITETLTNGIVLLSRNGGYINPLVGHRVDSRSHLSDVVSRGPNHLPYWHHFDTHSSQFSHKIPPLSKSDGSNSVEAQLERYVESNVGNCFNNFRAFSNRYEVQYEPLSALVTILDGRILIESNMLTNVEVLANNNIQSFDTFMSEVDTDFMRLYSAARDISRTQSLTGFIERPVLELISSQSGLNRVLPPFYEVEVFAVGAGDFWVREEVYNHIRRNILSRISSIQMLFTRNFNAPVELEGIETSFGEIATQEILDPMFDYSSLIVEFSYPSQSNPYIKVGSGSPILRGDEGSSDVGGGFSNLINNAVRSYRFNYELSFPVVSKVCDITSFRGRGLCLYYSLEGNIRYNDAFIPSTIDYGIEFGASSGDSQSVNLNDPAQYVDKTIRFEIVDKENGLPLNTARVFYSCGIEVHLANVRLSGGKTEFNGEMPFCAAGGHIIVRAPGYHSVSRPFNNVFGTSSVALPSFEMQRIKRVPVLIYKRPISGSASSDYIDLTADQIILHISKIRSSTREDEFPLVQTHVFGTTDSGSGSDFVSTTLDAVLESADYVEDESLAVAIEALVSGQTEIEMQGGIDDIPEEVRRSFSILELVPGEYEISLTYIVHGDPALHIGSELRRVCLSGERREHESCLIQLSSYELPELNFPSWVVSEISYVWEVTESDLYSSDYLRFFVPDIPLPRDHDELDAADEIEVNLNRFRPEFIQ